MIVVEGEENVVVVFPKLLPRRKTLEVVWRGARGCLWESKRVRNEKYQETEIGNKEKSVVA